ncbi:MAG: discoidin domain-containing protein [Acidobacteriota bacterium]
MRIARLLVAAWTLVLAPGGPPAAPRSADAFEDLAAWRAAPAEGVGLTLAGAPGLRGSALRLDYDFRGKAGWAAARRDWPVDLPDNYEISFSMRGEGTSNDLEVKLVDGSGENVWWAVRRELVPSSSWTRFRLKKRHFSFAWGPAGGGEIRRVAALEIAVTARTGGHGWIALDDLALTPLPPPGGPLRPVATASSALPGFAADRAVDGSLATAWRATANAPAWLTIDLGERREYGGVTIRWEPDRHAPRYTLETSDDDNAWTAVRTVVSGNGGRDDVFLPESESRWIRLRLPEASDPGYGVAEMIVQPLSYGETPNAFFLSIARESPRGVFPRSFSGEQSYWTVVGVSGDTESGLVSEDGAVEPAAGSFSVEPFLFSEGRLSTWADGETSHSLEDGDLPIPHVVRRRGGLSLDVTAAAAGSPGSGSLHVRYRLTNGGGSRRAARLFLAVRPFQVNPPSQFLNRTGGVARIPALAWDGRAVAAGGVRRIFPDSAPDGFGAASFDQGSVVDFLSAGRLPPPAKVEDPTGWASGALAFDFDLAAGQADEVSVELPLHAAAAGSSAVAPLRSRAEAAAASSQRLAALARDWREKIDRVVLEGPPAAQDLLRTLRTSLAEILIERDGPALRPGTRSYARSWIRDGAMMSAALLRLGHPEAVRAYANWFAGYQSPEGRVPCCVDARGADSVVENDSHGELIFLIAEDWRHTRDTEWLRGIFPHVEKAVAWIDRERRRRRTAEYAAPGRRIFFGLLPESISHEGYSAKPVHSYWDDFWALKGLRDATDLAAALGREDERAAWARIRDEFEADLHASIARVRELRKIDFIPGSADLGDFDATSTTIALDPAGELGRLPADAVRATFERYWREFERRRGSETWEDYTPYEIRNVGAFIRLGWRDRAHALLPFFFASRRPAGWNGWAEAVGREPRKVRFIGDMPHAWVASDFIRSALDLFAFERESDGAVVLGAGIPASWVSEGPGVAIRRLRTSRGLLDYSLRREGGRLRFRVSGSLDLPPGGIVLRPPLPGPGCSATSAKGEPMPCQNGEVTVDRLPAEVTFR